MGNFGEMPLGRFDKFSLSPISLFQGLSMEMYSRVNLSLCLFLAISGRSPTQQKSNPLENSRYTVHHRIR